MNRQLALMEADQRPWVFARNAYPWSPLVIHDQGAEIVIQFVLKNSGKSPARFVNVEGSFFALAAIVGTQNQVDTREIYKEWDSCDTLRKATTLTTGIAVFPGDETPHNHIFKLDAAGMATWKDATRPSALMIVGCVDYLYGAMTAHHQSKFIYELDKPGPDRTFLRIEPTPGIVPFGQLILAVNPNLAKDAD